MNDRFVVTRGIVERGQPFIAAAVEKVAKFSEFTGENDPKGEHDFGIVDVEGVPVYFKIDYYSPDLQGASLDPAEPACTARVLTVLLASEY
jgi:hypothetical protein